MGIDCPAHCGEELQESSEETARLLLPCLPGSTAQKHVQLRLIKQCVLVERRQIAPISVFPHFSRSARPPNRNKDLPCLVLPAVERLLIIQHVTLMKAACWEAWPLTQPFLFLRFSSPQQPDAGFAAQVRTHRKPLPSLSQTAAVGRMSLGFCVKQDRDGDRQRCSFPAETPHRSSCPQPHECRARRLPRKRSRS